MRFLILSILTLGLLGAAEDPKLNPLPADVQAIITKADKAAADIQAKADAEILKIRMGMIAPLTKAQDAAMKKNDLTAAVAIKAKLDEINDLIKKAAVAADPMTPVKARIIGRWSVRTNTGNMIWTFNEDGTASSQSGYKGTWNIVKDKVQVKWSHGTEGFDVPKDGETTTNGTSLKGNPLELEKMP